MQCCYTWPCNYYQYENIFSFSFYVLFNFFNSLVHVLFCFRLRGILSFFFCFVRCFHSFVMLCDVFYKIAHTEMETLRLWLMVRPTVWLTWSTLADTHAFLWWLIIRHHICEYCVVVVPFAVIEWFFRFRQFGVQYVMHFQWAHLRISVTFLPLSSFYEPAWFTKIEWRRAGAPCHTMVRITDMCGECMRKATVRTSCEMACQQNVF